FHRRLSSPFSCGFFFLVVAPTVVSSLSLHDALPISRAWLRPGAFQHACHCLPAGLAAVHGACRPACRRAAGDAAGTYEALRKATDRKSTRLNSSHVKISYAVFCLKKKKSCVVSCSCW